MFGIGGWELLVVAVAALVILGPKGLPAAARAVGRVASELRRATNDLRQSIELDPDLKEIPQALEEINRPLLSASPRHRRRDVEPRDGPPKDLPPRPPRRDVEIEDDESEDTASFISDVDAGATAADGLPPYAAAAVGGERPPPLEAGVGADAERSADSQTEGDDPDAAPDADRTARRERADS